VFCDVRFQVLTAASMMFRVVFWAILPCKMIVDRRFRGAYYLRHQGWVIPEDNSEHVFWDIAPCNLLNIYRRFLRGTYYHHDQGDKMFSETSVSVCQTTIRIVPEDSRPHRLRRENLKSHSGMLTDSLRTLRLFLLLSVFGKHLSKIKYGWQ
jgi:hypothetical protein